MEILNEMANGVHEVISLFRTSTSQLLFNLYADLFEAGDGFFDGLRHLVIVPMVMVVIVLFCGGFLSGWLLHAHGRRDGWGSLRWGRWLLAATATEERQPREHYGQHQQ